ncbi:MAG: HesB/IscA family protein [Thermoplasmata archaeon]
MTVKLEVTKEAKDQVRALIQGQKPGTGVRIFVQAGGSGGGCGSGGCGCGSEGGGTSFGLAFDRPRNGDEVVQVDGFSVIVDSTSTDAVNGAKIDFVQSLDATGFTVTSPNLPEAAKAPGGGGCGCGSGGSGSGGCGSGSGGGCC